MSTPVTKVVLLESGELRYQLSQVGIGDPQSWEADLYPYVMPCAETEMVPGEIAALLIMGVGRAYRSLVLPPKVQKRLIEYATTLSYGNKEFFQTVLKVLRAAEVIDPPTDEEKTLPFSAG